MNRSIDWIRAGLKKRKVKVFLLFLFCATLAWFINNLSKTYTSNTFFEINYINIPKDIILAKKPKDKIQVRLQTVGFQFLGYGLRPKQITLDVSKVMENDSRFQLTSDQIKIQLEAQLANNSSLIDFDKDPIYFDFTSLHNKKVKVEVLTDLSFDNNYILKDKVFISPDSIEITGPKSVLDTIQIVNGNPVKLSNLSKNFSITVPLKLPTITDNFKVSQKEVILKGTVVKFGERLIEVPITVINLPEAVAVRTFPENVEVRVQGTLDKIKELAANDFRVTADYRLVNPNGENRLPISLVEFPDYLISATTDINEIEFILRRE